MSQNSEQLDADFVDHSSPELKMWAAVLNLAIIDAEPWITRRTEMTLEQQAYGNVALNWMLSNSKDPGGYIWVCYNLGLCHDRIRNMIGIGNKKNIW